MIISHPEEKLWARGSMFPGSKQEQSFSLLKNISGYEESTIRSQTHITKVKYSTRAVRCRVNSPRFFYYFMCVTIEPACMSLTTCVTGAQGT